MSNEAQERAITFVCAECGEEKTELRAVGPMPKYCLVCAPKVYKRQQAARARRYRAKKRSEG